MHNISTCERYITKYISQLTLVYLYYDTTSWMHYYGIELHCLHRPESLALIPFVHIPREATWRILILYAFALYILYYFYISVRHRWGEHSGKSWLSAIGQAGLLGTASRLLHGGGRNRKQW